MKKTTQFRDSIPPSLEAIGNGKWLVHWNVQKQQDEQDTDRIYYSYNEVKLDHKPTKTEIKKIKLL